MATPLVCLKKLPPNEKQLSVSTSSAGRSSHYRARFLNSASIEKMFEGPETFVISNDNMDRCNSHNEISLFRPRKFKS